MAALENTGLNPLDKEKAPTAEEGLELHRLVRGIPAPQEV